MFPLLSCCAVCTHTNLKRENCFTVEFSVQSKQLLKLKFSYCKQHMTSQVVVIEALKFSQKNFVCNSFAYEHLWLLFNIYSIHSSKKNKATKILFVLPPVCPLRGLLHLRILWLVLIAVCV